MFKLPLALATSLVLTSCAVGVRRPAEPSGERRGAIVPASKLQWRVQTPGLPIRMAMLWGDREVGPFGELVKLPGGFDSGLHAHTGAYRGILIAGTWIHIEEDGTGAGQELTPGSYVFQPGRGMHIDRCKVGAECILFIYQTERPDILWPKTHRAP
jgi:hypothetical protein